MTSLIDHLKQRVTETQSALGTAEQAVARATSKKEELEADLAGYVQAHQAELRRSGTDSARREAEAIKAEDAATAAATLAALSDEDETNKTGVVKAIINEHASDGIASANVVSEAARRNVHIKRNYVYSILLRLKNRGRIARRRGRYFPVRVQADTGKVVNIAG